MGAQGPPGAPLPLSRNPALCFPTFPGDSQDSIDPPGAPATLTLGFHHPHGADKNSMKVYGSTPWTPNPIPAGHRDPGWDPRGPAGPGTSPGSRKGGLRAFKMKRHLNDVSFFVPWLEGNTPKLKRHLKKMKRHARDVSLFGCFLQRVVQKMKRRVFRNETSFA